LAWWGFSVVALLVMAGCGGNDIECPGGSCADTCDDDCSFTCEGGQLYAGLRGGDHLRCVLRRRELLL